MFCVGFFASSMFPDFILTESTSTTVKDFFQGTINVYEGTSINCSEDYYSHEQELLSFSYEKAPALTPCLDHSNHPGAEIISTIAEEAFGKLKANFALHV